MSDKIKIFEFEAKQVRTVIGEDGEPMFVAKDVCEVLETETRDVRKVLDDDEVDTIHIIDSIGRDQEVTSLTESGLYHLIMVSRKDNAKRFRKWVTAEVLPSIRKTGSYIAPRLEQRTRIDFLVARESRLERQFQHKALVRLLKVLPPTVDQIARQALEVSAAELATGKNLKMLAPVLDEPWEMPEEIGKRYGMAANAVGRVITELGIRGDKRYSKEYVSKSKTSDRNVFPYIYNREGVALIEGAIKLKKAG
jgi:prophage antirepressor-like protein